MPFGDAVSMDLGTGTTVGTTASIGVEPYANWVQTTGFPNFSRTNMADQTTTATTLDLTAAALAGNVSSRAAGSGDLFNMYTRGVAGTGGAGSTFAFSDNPYAEYDVILYFGEQAANSAGNLQSFSDGTTTYYYDTQGADNFNSGTFTQVTSTSSGSPDTAGNYVRFSGLTAAAVTVTVVSILGGDIALVGMQVIEVTGGASTILPFRMRY